MCVCVCIYIYIYFFFLIIVETNYKNAIGNPDYSVAVFVKFLNHDQ